MSLSCSCHEYDGEGWFYYRPSDYSVLSTKRGRKCCSCGGRIAVGDTVLAFDRARGARYEIEERIYGGTDIPLATWFMCESCGDQYLNLTELGFCITIPANMMEMLAQYAQMKENHHDH